MKSWNIEVYMLDEMGNEKPANCFTKVTYNLHPSFENPIQSEYAKVVGIWNESNVYSFQLSLPHHSAARTRDGERLT